MRKKINYLCSLALMLCLFAVIAMPSKAAYQTTATVTARTSNSITVTWPAATGVYEKYYIGIGTSQSAADEDCNKMEKSESSTITSHTFNDLISGTGYCISVKYFTNKEKAETKDPSKLVDYAYCSAYTIPSTPVNLRQTWWTYRTDKLKVQWDCAGNVSGYEVTVWDSDGDKTVKTITDNTKEIVLNTEYTRYFKLVVRSFVLEPSGTKIYSESSEALTSFSQPQIKEVEDGYDIVIKNKKMYITWDRVKEGNGYEVYVSNKKYGTYKKVKYISSNKTTKATLSKYNGKRFNPKGTYYVYVVATKRSSSKITRSSATYVYLYKKGETFMTLKKN